ncbi:hypothetical protein KCP70_06635 [Salmonella enterica subsp. enterica]|nr:hypothetical protein KCP70_06635 [Salmonella enterica subsp. enterica]
MESICAAIFITRWVLRSDEATTHRENVARCSMFCTGRQPRSGIETHWIKTWRLIAVPFSKSMLRDAISTRRPF